MTKYNQKHNMRPVKLTWYDRYLNTSQQVTLFAHCLNLFINDFSHDNQNINNTLKVAPGSWHVQTHFTKEVYLQRKICRSFQCFLLLFFSLYLLLCVLHQDQDPTAPAMQMGSKNNHKTQQKSLQTKLRYKRV